MRKSEKYVDLWDIGDILKENLFIYEEIYKIFTICELQFLFDLDIL